MADAGDLKSPGPWAVRVRVPPPACPHSAPLRAELCSVADTVCDFIPHVRTHSTRLDSRREGYRSRRLWNPDVRTLSSAACEELFYSVGAVWRRAANRVAELPSAFLSCAAGGAFLVTVLCEAADSPSVASSLELPSTASSTSSADDSVEAGGVCGGSSCVVSLDDTS